MDARPHWGVHLPPPEASSTSRGCKEIRQSFSQGPDVTSMKFLYSTYFFMGKETTVTEETMLGIYCLTRTAKDSGTTYELMWRRICSSQEEGQSSSIEDSV